MHTVENIWQCLWKSHRSLWLPGNSPTQGGAKILMWILLVVRLNAWNFSSGSNTALLFIFRIVWKPGSYVWKMGNLRTCRPPQIFWRHGKNQAKKRILSASQRLGVGRGLVHWSWKKVRVLFNQLCHRTKVISHWGNTNTFAGRERQLYVLWPTQLETSVMENFSVKTSKTALS